MQETRSPIWPLVILLTCTAVMTGFGIWSCKPQAIAPQRAVPDAAAPAPAAGVAATDQPPASTAEEDCQQEAVAPQDPLSELASFAVPPRRARPAPPVADRISVDPSLADPPLLPTIEPSLRSDGAGGAARTMRAPQVPAKGGAQSGKLHRQSVQRSPDLAHVWPYARSLVHLLEATGDTAAIHSWRDRLTGALAELHAIEVLGAPAAGELLETLQQLAHEAMALAGGQRDLNQRAALLRAAYALQRRLAIWQPVYELARPKLTQVSLHHSDPTALLDKLRAADTQLARLSNPQQWREYLLLDQLAAIASQQRNATSYERSNLAREFLSRLESADSTLQQEQFFAHRAWQEVAFELRHWVSEPVDYEALLDDLERVEDGYGEKTGRNVATQYQILRWSSSPELAELGDRINAYYRNANVRCAISGELLNRLLPHPEPVDENVNDRVLGGRVFGRSRVTTRLRLVLLPDRERWRLGLEANGDVDSRTQTQRGPARFHNVGRSRYRVLKMLLIDRRGVHTQDAEGAALTDADLTGMDTNLDGVPLVNLLVRAAAKQMYDRQVDEAEYQTQGLLANRAESRMDSEVDEKLSAATEKFRTTIWRPLRGLGLRPEAVDMQTTADRLIVRYRLAGYDQVAAFTPRPQAPANSLLSIQVHQSMLNNVVSSLDLGGREVGLRDLFAEVARKLKRNNYQIPDDVPDDVTIQLAATDPIHFECKDDRIHITLRIAKLAAGDNHTWHNFEVRGMYLPCIDGIRVGIERDSYIRLKGYRRRLSTGDQVVLRGIFAKVLAPHPDIDLLAGVLINDQRLHDLRVSQFVVCDGWIGIAVGSGSPIRMHIADDPQQARLH